MLIDFEKICTPPKARHLSWKWGPGRGRNERSSPTKTEAIPDKHVEKQGGGGARQHDDGSLKDE
jgi:hypothetical protein